MRNPWSAAGLAIVLVIVVILARGYAFVKSHGSLQVDAVDVSDTSPSRTPHLAPLTLTFFDEAGTQLARTAADSATGSIYVTTPADYACRAVELRAATDLDARREWSRCFARQSRWLMTWVPRAKFVDIDAPLCTLRRNPVAITQSEDQWWLWWLPLRHVGGDPYTYWRAEVRFDRARCIRAGAVEVAR